MHKDAVLHGVKVDYGISIIQINSAIIGFYLFLSYFWKEDISRIRPFQKSKGGELQRGRSTLLYMLRHVSTEDDF